MDAPWLVGFMEGAGCFSIVIRKSSTQVGYQVIADFTIKLPLAQKGLLEDIQRFLNVGKVYASGKQAQLKATSLEDAQRIVAFFKRKTFQSTTTQKEFRVWSECVSLMATGKHLSTEGVLQIAHLRDSIHHKQLWNKKSFCTLRKEMDPCHVYQETQALPTGCRVCWNHTGKETPHTVKIGGTYGTAAD